MASCELCGRNPSTLKCQVEGTMMNVCQECSRFGDVKGRSNVRIVVEERKKLNQEEPEYVFASGYGMIVKNAREKINLTQEDFAKSINEHKSLLHQVESEHIKPNIIFARKLEKALKIKIVEQVSKNSEDKFDATGGNKSHKNINTRTQSSSQGLTFADILNNAKKK